MSIKRNYPISVAMASYNGEKYIEVQIRSILANLCEKDELIISDDGSTDRTLEIINKISDKRIRVLQGPKLGVKKNFEHAARNCSGKYIFLSDQDDVWLENKVEKMLEVFEKTGCNCVTHNAEVKNGDMTQTIIDSFFSHRKSGPGILKNIYKNRYLGCCMAFSKEIKSKILPIPNNIEMHDQWIGIICEKYGKSVFIDDKLIYYRRHDNNVSNMNHYPLFKMIRNRIVFVLEFIRRVI